MKRISIAVALFVFVLAALAQGAVVATGNDPVPSATQATSAPAVTQTAPASQFTDKEVGEIKATVSAVYGDKKNPGILKDLKTMKEHAKSQSEETKALKEIVGSHGTSIDNNKESIRKQEVARQELEKSFTEKVGSVLSTVKTYFWTILVIVIIGFLGLGVYLFFERKEIGVIKKDVNTIRKVVSPDEFVLEFNANGEAWEYDVPVDERGKFVSIATVNLEPDEEIKNVVDLPRIACETKRDLKKSCKSAMNEYGSPNCSREQKAVIDLLKDTFKLRPEKAAK